MSILQVETMDAVRAVVIIGSGQTFIAGADIREIASIAAGERPPLDLLIQLQTIEDSSKPVVCAIRGAAFGGGLETAMCAHYRVSTRDAQFAQPEVKLGLIPGAGGTQRLPRLVGVLKAAEMCALGKTIRADEAQALGLTDRILEGDLLEGAIAFAREVSQIPIRKTSNRNEKLRSADWDGLGRLSELVRSTERPLRAPIAAIEAVEAALNLSFDDGCQREAELFSVCLHSDESKALIHAFFAERTAGKAPAIAKSANSGEIRAAAVVGAGLMGGGIAMTFANAGIPVLVKERSQDALDRGMVAIEKNYARTVEKGRLSPSAAKSRLDLITPQLDLANFDKVDLIIEAVFEDQALKESVAAELDSVAHPGCILASNTSSLDVDAIAAATSRPERFLGIHFFSPANVMRLLEIVRGGKTSGETVASCMALGKRLGKIAVLSENHPGFIGNRIIRPYLREARFLAEEGASVEAINTVLLDFGMSMGPLAVDDLIGLDVSWSIEEQFRRFDPPEARRSLALDSLYQRGRFGQKTGSGWSSYDPNRRSAPNPEVAEILESLTAKPGIARRAISSDEIRDRCICSLVNEGARVLEERVARRASDIDVTFIHGYGFPSWRGGPMFYADTVGLKSILTKVREFQDRFGSALWSPASLLVEVANSRKSFSDRDREAPGN